MLQDRRDKSIRLTAKNTEIKRFMALGFVAVLLLSSYAGMGGAFTPRDKYEALSGVDEGKITGRDIRSNSLGSDGGVVSDEDETVHVHISEAVPARPDVDSNDSSDDQPVCNEGASTSPLVFVVVAGNIYDEVIDNVSNYQTDVEALGYNVTIIQWEKTGPGIENASLLRRILFDNYTNYGLVGALFVGDIPYVTIKFSGSPVVSDLYFWDLDGVQLDTDGDGVFDAYHGARSPEIWVGRLMASQITKHDFFSDPDHAKEVGFINNYFVKNHAYRTNDSTHDISNVSRRGLLFSYGWCDVIENNLGLIYDAAHSVNVIGDYDDPDTPALQDYLDLVDKDGPGFETVMIGGHGACVFGYHYGEGFGFDEIMDFDPKGLFYDLQGCGSGDYTYFRNIGSSYVFAPTYGLAALGLIRSDTLNEERRYYTQLSQGFCLGDTLLDWQRYTHEMFMAIIGDPLLVLPNATWVGEGHKPPHTPGVPVCDPLFGIIGDVGTSYEFTINTSDPGGNRIWYMVDWGDGTTWVSPLVPPGEPQTISHSWSESGVYRVRVRATDEDYANGAVGAMSGWSDPLVVTIANPEISVNPSSIQFQVEEGTPCDPQTLTIGNYGILPLEFTITNTSFEPLDEIDSPGESQRDGSGAVDHENNVYLVWSDSTGGYYQGYTGYVVYRTWTHSTQEWSMDNVILDELTCGDEYPCRTPSVAVDPAGNVHVVWTRYDGSMWYRKWDDSTQQWIPSLDDDPAYVGYGWMPSIATDSQGVVHMVWYRNGHVYYKNTVTWTGAGQIICTGSPYQPLLAVDAFDNLHVVWRYGANQLYHKLWDATERAWSTVQPVFNQSFTTVEEYSLDVDAYDNLHVVWLCKELNGTRNIYYSKWDSGTREWTPNTDLELITSITYGGVYWGQRYVSMAVDAKDNVYLLWLDKNPDYPNFPKLFYKVRVALLDSWTETMTPDEIGANRATVQPLLLADNLGTIHMLTLSGWEIYVTRALSPGIDWLSMELVSGVVDPGGNVAVNLSVDTTGLAKGLYRVYLVLESNDVSDPMIKVPVNLTVLSSVPAAPQVCVSWWGDNYVNLSWINVTRTEDGFPLRDLAGFRVYRNVTGSWSAFEQRAEVAAPATFYHETGLAPGLFYYYRVTAVDASGHESGYAVCEKLRRGDMNHDGKITIIDVVYLTNYLFIGGPAPLPLAAGDASNDGKVNVNDVVFLTNYLFINGPPPVYQELPDMLPRADAGSDQMVHIDNEVIFDGSDSHDPDGTIVSYVWDFGDDSLPSPGMITTHTYADNRTYTVTLTVTDNLGGTDTDTCCVQVLPWVLHVPDDLDSIQTAIAIAFDGQTILVAPGTYRETLDFLGKAVTVQSTGGPEITVIDGGQCWSVVTFDSGETSSSVLDGFTITNGNALYGAGIYCGHGSSPTIRNNDIVFNVATEGGGFFCDSLSSPVLSNNNITQNTAVTSGGGIYCSGIATITNNNISSNTLIGSNGYGGGIYCSAAATITNNNISSNTVNFCGGGIYCSAAALITNNIISNNQVVNYHSAFLYGGGIYCSGSATITNNIILNNHMTVSSSISSRGGGIYCDQSVTITNNIISKNAAKSGGGIYCNSGSPTIINNIISDNTHGPLAHGGGIYCQVDSSPSITYCDVWDNQDNYYQCSPGIGCIEANPLFINHPLWGPYYLGSGSPCIDAGDPSTNYNDIEDPNNPGFALPPSQGTLRNDMGCYGGPTPLLYSLLLD